VQINRSKIEKMKEQEKARAEAQHYRNWFAQQQNYAICNKTLASGLQYVISWDEVVDCGQMFAGQLVITTRNDGTIFHNSGGFVTSVMHGTSPTGVSGTWTTYGSVNLRISWKNIIWIYGGIFSGGRLSNRFWAESCGSYENATNTSRGKFTFNILQVTVVDANPPLPFGWEQKINEKGLPYFVNHSSRQTSWYDPVSGERLLPFGWERAVDANNKVYFINHNMKTTTYNDPRTD